MSLSSDQTARLHPGDSQLPTWAVVGDFRRAGRMPVWLHTFIPEGSFNFAPVFTTRQLQPAGWHARQTGRAGLEEWASHLQQAKDAWRMNPSGVITIFPQAAAAAGALKRLQRREAPLLAWCFNVGNPPTGLQGTAARWALSAVDTFVVHSRRERETLSRWLGLPIERFTFVPLQSAPIRVSTSEEVESPFVLAMGSAHRDYETLLAAVGKVGMRTVVVASPRSLAGLSIPPNVELRAGLSLHECRELAKQARINVVPLRDTSVAAGQVTLLDAMNLGTPVIASKVTGTVDYIEDGKTGLLVPPGSSRHLSDTIGDLWSDEPRRRNLGRAAAAYVARELSDVAIAAQLANILRGLSR